MINYDAVGSIGTGSEHSGGTCILIVGRILLGKRYPLNEKTGWLNLQVQVA